MDLGPEKTTSSREISMTIVDGISGRVLDRIPTDVSGGIPEGNVRKISENTGDSWGLSERIQNKNC